MNNFQIIDQSKHITPTVSVAMLTYNHAEYINKAIESVLIQKTNFNVKIIIADDCSTDATRQIIIDFQKRYPEKIKLILQDKNVGSQNNNFDLLSNLEGKYIAALEGDDYWTDTLKLQKQVDFLELNPSYGFVCSAYKAVFTETKKEEVVLKDIESYKDNTAKGFDITIERFLKDWLTQPLTLLFRKEYNILDELKTYNHTRDVHLIYHLLKKANGYYMKEVFGVYNINGLGIFTSTSNTERLIIAYLIYKELYENNKEDRFIKKKYVNYLLAMINNKLYLQNDLYTKYKLIWELFGLIENKKDFETALRVLNTQYIGIKNIFKKRKYSKE